ncbi:MAG: hypothetical protein C0399_04565 [Syntrophus sp. (in: bacteria)]|nr:hypothetical protein [Syntrophus sp. (in: bacteria)]
MRQRPNNEEETNAALTKELSRLRRTIASLEASRSKFKQMEGALRESEQRYRSLVKQSSDGVYLIDPKTGRIIEANTQFLKMLGYSEKEITRLTLYDIVMLSKKNINYNTKKVLQDKQYVFGLRKYRQKDGRFIDVEINSTVVNYGDAHVVMVNVRDVTERKKSENELAQQSAILREQAELLDIAEDAIIVRNMKDRIVFWNCGAEKKFGWTSGEASGMVTHHLLKTKFPHSSKEIRKEFLKKGHWDGELVHTNKDGQHIVVESKWTLRKDKKGKPIAIMEINNDITERKKAETALQKTKDELEVRVTERTKELQEANVRLTQELNRRKQIEDMLRMGAERYKNLFENSPIGIYRINPAGLILMANPTLIRMMGYSSFDELNRGRKKAKGFEPTYLSKKIKDRLEREGRVRGFEAVWKLPDTSIMYVRENAKAIKTVDGKTQYYEGTVEDISERKKAEEKIQQHQKQLRSLASELSLAEERERRRIATLLHDHIGQILAISKIKLGALLERAKTGIFRENLSEVREHIEQAIKYTRSLTLKLSPPILYELGLEPALEWLAEQIEEQHGIRCEFENDGSEKPLNEELRVFLFTAVRELLVNVAKHARAQRVKVTVRRSGETISIHVADDGVGFCVSKKSPYVDENKGFGLFSIRERLHHLGGHVEVRSQKSRGTRIALTAPLKNEHETKGSKTI